MKAILLTVAVFSLVAAAAAQEHPTVAAQPNTVFVGADGKFEAAPDTALLQFNISDQEPNPKSAYDHVSKSTEQVRQILRTNGIDPRQAEFGSYSLQPVFDYRSPDRKPVGYRVTASVSLKLRWFTRFELELLLERGGWHLDELYGNYNLDPFGPDSERLIAIARLT